MIIVPFQAATFSIACNVLSQMLILHWFLKDHARHVIVSRTTSGVIQKFW